MHKSTSILAGAALLAAGALHFATSEAEASPLVPGKSGIAAAANNEAVTEQVQYRPRVNRGWNRSGWHGGWNRFRHGDRFRFRHGGYRHFYGGYWYNNPWWLGAAITAPLAFGAPYAYDYDYDDDYAAPAYGYNSGSGHVQWCYSRYRSYDAVSDTYMGYDGYRHPCNSPY